MTALASDTRKSPLLIDARRFTELAELTGITQTATALALAGRLTPLHVGRRTVYDSRELLELMPAGGRVLFAGVMAVERSLAARHTKTTKDATR